MLIRLISFFFLLSSACTTGVEPEKSYHNKILFTSTRSGEQQLYMMNPDGTDIRQITSGAIWHYFGRWSPDAQQIVALTTQNITTACVQTVVMNANGSNRRLIGCGGPMEWSPDGKKIVFAFSPRAELGDLTRYIYIINADGTGRKQLTDNFGVQDDIPSWSPDGSRIAFSSNRDYPPAPLRSEIYLMNADGSNQRRITYTDSLINGAPAWSPDGTKIAFSSSGNIVVIDTNGSNLNILAQFSVGGKPAWSPDGSKLVFARHNIYMVNNDGSNLRVVLADSLASTPDWSK